MMSNRIDFHLPQEHQSSVPAGRSIVFVDGVLCPYLSVKELVRASAPTYGSARLVYNPAVCPQGQRIAPEDVDRIAPLGCRISIASVYDGGMGQASVETLPLFAGRIEQIETNINGDGEFVEVVARDFAARMARITVFGRRLLDRSGRTLRLEGRDLTFNAADLPNASAVAVQCAGLWRRVFDDDTARATHWTCAEAIRYLLCEHLLPGDLAIPTIEQLEAFFAGRTLPAIDLTGDTLLDALERCCAATGVKFRFESAEPQTSCDQCIIFYRPGTGRAVELNHQPRGQRFDLARTNICRLSTTRRPAVTHRFLGLGGWKTYEATFPLVKAWDPSLEGGPQELYAPSTNPDFAAVQDVYRRWCLNEAGDWSGPPYNRGEPFDFSRIFERADYTRRRRRFENALTTRDGASTGRFLEVSYDGATWREYTDTFEVLDDECGVRLTGDPLPAELWTAIAAGTLAFRVTAAAPSDTRLTAAASSRPVNSAAEVFDHLIESADFQYRKVSPQSIFYRTAAADERDDTQALYARVRHLCETYSPAIETIDAETPIVAQFFQPGDRVTCGPDSRDLLGIRRDTQSIFTIDRVTVDCEKQSTRLRILRIRRRP